MDLDQGQPFNNILIEVAGTMGLAGLVPVFGILVYAVISFTKVVRGRQTEAAAYFMSFFAIFLALQFESTFLRYYLWTPLGLGLGVLAQTKKPPMTKPTQVPLQAPA
jgi:O-antigen ligase